MIADRSVGAASVSAEGWGWRYSGRSAWAVRGLELRVRPGERVLLLGSSGAGKSTLLHGLGGVLGGDDDGEQAGGLLIDGVPAAQARGRAGLLLQDPDAQVILARVGDDAAFGPENLGLPRDEIWRRVGEALEAVGLGLPLQHPTSALSGGQKQRLALAGVLAMHPGLLLLDEPTASLDPDGVAGVRAAVERVLERTGATLIVVEHRVEVWRDLVERVIVLDPGGGVLADGPVDAVLREQGAALAEAGVWVPEHPPERPVRIRRPSPTGSAPLLRTEGLAIARTSDAVLARDLALAVCEGGMLAVTGPNGSGKTTLGLTLGGLLPPASGLVDASALAGGLPPAPHEWRSRELLTRIGTVFQDPEHQFIAATVWDELAVGARALGLGDGEVRQRVEPLLERLRLAPLAKANPFTLSGGEKRRLSVATALVTRPRVLVLDEPTFGQDSRTWRELLAFLAELLDEGSGIVAVTHDRHLVAALADEEFVLDGGRAASHASGVRG